MLSSLKGAQMIYQYDLVRDDDLKPYLQIVKEIDADDTDQYDEESTVFLLNKYYGLKDYIAEHIYAVVYSDVHTILGIYCMSIGDYKSCDIYHRELAMIMALTGAIYFRIFHNHPDSSMEVSEQDKGSAEAFDVFAKVLGVEFKGSFIIGKLGWKSVEDEDVVCNFYEED